MNAPLDSFETALLKQLRDRVDQQKGDVRPASSRRRHVLRHSAARVCAKGVRHQREHHLRAAGPAVRSGQVYVSPVI